jgi:hypothetical protein
MFARGPLRPRGPATSCGYGWWAGRSRHAEEVHGHGEHAAARPPDQPTSRPGRHWAPAVPDRRGRDRRPARRRAHPRCLGRPPRHRRRWAVRLGGGLRGADPDRGGAVDPPGAQAPGARRRHAATARAGRLGGRHRTPHGQRGRQGPGPRLPGQRPQRPRGGRRAGPRPGLLVPLPGRRPAQPAGADQDLPRLAPAAGPPGAGVRVASTTRRATTPRTGTSPRRTSTWSSTSATTSTRTPRAATCHAATSAGSRPTCPATGSATRSTRPTVTSRRPTPVTRSCSPGTTTRSRTTTPAATRSRAATRPRSCAAGRPPTAPTGSTCRCAGRRVAPPCPCTGGCASVTWSR